MTRISPLAGRCEVHILVLQWPVSSEADFETLIAMEDLLEAGLPKAHGFVDGHDVGAGEMNISVHTDRPAEAFRYAMALLTAHPGWAGVRAAYRRIDGDRYVVVWPQTLDVFSVS